jgi:hypothetical protein
MAQQMTTCAQFFFFFFFLVKETTWKNKQKITSWEDPFFSLSRARSNRRKIQALNSTSAKRVKKKINKLKFGC